MLKNVRDPLKYIQIIKIIFKNQDEVYIGLFSQTH